MWYKIRKQNTEYTCIFMTPLLRGLLATLSSVTFLVNNEATPISRTPRDVAFRKSLYEFTDSFALNSEYLNDF